MAGSAIVVDTAQALGVGCIVVRPRSGIGLMLVLVMTDVLRSAFRFVLAIAGNRRPGELERQENKEDDGEEAAHGGEF